MVVPQLIEPAAAVLLFQASPTQAVHSLQRTVGCHAQMSPSANMINGRANHQRCRQTGSARHIARSAASRSIRCTRRMQRQTVSVRGSKHALPVHLKFRHRLQALIGSARSVLYHNTSLQQTNRVAQIVLQGSSATYATVLQSLSSGRVPRASRDSTRALRAILSASLVPQASIARHKRHRRPKLMLVASVR